MIPLFMCTDGLCDEWARAFLATILTIPIVFSVTATFGARAFGARRTTMLGAAVLGLVVGGLFIYAFSEDLSRLWVLGFVWRFWTWVFGYPH